MNITDFANIMMLVCFGFAIFNLGQAYALIRETRRETERHIEFLEQSRRNRG